MEDREKRQYFNDLYGIFLGSNIKNGHSQDPKDILKLTEIHWKALIARMETVVSEGTEQ